MRTLRVLLFAAALIAPLSASAEPEHEIKAAFLFQFLSYVEWPSSSFEEPSSPFVIGVMGDDEVLAGLQQIVPGRSAQGRPVEVRKVHGERSIAGIHLLFVGRADASLLPEFAKGKGVLVVGEAEGALDRGAMINLLRVGDNVRFEVCPEAAERSELRISSRMLAVAQFVKPRRP